MIKMIANAKINLFIDVIKIREDLYHEVNMVMQSIDLSDTVILEKAQKHINIFCNNKEVPCNEKNIVFKAAEMFMKRNNISSGINIIIEKNIPISAGLAGGSTDAAATIKGLNLLFNTNLEIEVLKKMAGEIGSDVPFCIEGGTTLAKGRGDILTKLRSLGSVEVVLLKPSFGVSTPWVYQNLDLRNLGERPNTKLLMEYVLKGDWEGIVKNMRNVLESVANPKYPIINVLKEKLIRIGADGALMSGSGSTVFGIFLNKFDKDEIINYFKDSNIDCFFTKTL